MLGDYYRGRRHPRPPKPSPQLDNNASTIVFSLASKADRGRQQLSEATKKKVVALI
jgi:hypothetical protein